MYANGHGVLQDYKQTYVWYSLAATNGHSVASKWRDLVASELTPQQLSDAKQEAKVLFDKIEANKQKQLNNN
jgi:uncharacterized protein